MPSAPQTGKSERKCIFASHSDCGGGKSGDHFLSASVMRQIATTRITLVGPGYARSAAVRSDSFKVNLLCRRHNSALSPLDTEAGRLFRAVQDTERALARQAEPRLRTYLFAGLDIERWLTKTLLGAYYGKVTNVAPGTHELPPHTMSLFEGSLVAPYGLYIPSAKEGQDLHSTRLARRASLGLITEGALVAGIEVSLGGLELRFVISGSPQAMAQEQERGAHRPKFINFYEGEDVYTFGLGWIEDSDRSIWMSRGDADAPLPTN